MREIVLIAATADSEAGIMPSADLIEAMENFNRELVDAGIVRGGEGIKSSSEGKRVAFDRDGRTVIEGPFPAVGELVAGFWLWEVNDMDGALEWVKRSPNPMPAPSEIEIRPLFELSDFAGVMTLEQANQEERQRGEF